LRHCAGGSGEVEVGPSGLWTTCLQGRHRWASVVCGSGLDPAQEPLLAIPDAIGWAWARGADWRRRARALVSDVIDV